MIHSINQIFVIQGGIFKWFSFIETHNIIMIFYSTNQIQFFRSDDISTHDILRQETTYFL